MNASTSVTMWQNEQRLVMENVGDLSGAGVVVEVGEVGQGEWEYTVGGVRLEEDTVRERGGEKIRRAGARS